MKKTLTIILAFVLVIAMSVAGTVAYLTAQTGAVTNTFTVGNIGDLTLTEEKGTVVDGKHTFNIVPGQDIAKDPKVTYTADEPDVAVYVFVKMDATGWTTTDGQTYTKAAGSVTEALSFSIDTTAWTKLENGVYYKALDANTDLAATSVIANDTIAVSDSIAKDDIGTLAGSDLVFTAYAIQQAGFDTAAAAWAEVNK